MKRARDLHNNNAESMWFTTWNLPSKGSLVPLKTCPVGWTFSRATIQQCLAQIIAECLAKDQQSKFNASVLLCFALPTCWLSYFSQQIEHWMGFPSSSYWSSGRPLWQSETGHRWAHQHPDKRCESKSFEENDADSLDISGHFYFFWIFLPEWWALPERWWVMSDVFFSNFMNLLKQIQQKHSKTLISYEEEPNEANPEKVTELHWTWSADGRNGSIGGPNFDGSMLSNTFWHKLTPESQLIS